MPSQTPRPSNRELNSKVEDAITAILAGRRVLGVTKHLSGDFVALGISSEAEIWSILPELLREIKAADPVTCYVGGSPPARSYDQEMKHMELWPYRWPSLRLGKQMFLKFAMKRNKQGDWIYYHVDVHEDRS